jgi:hypothetical protein
MKITGVVCLAAGTQNDNFIENAPASNKGLRIVPIAYSTRSLPIMHLLETFLRYCGQHLAMLRVLVFRF